jgi:class 3 adenylate cyclase
MSWSKDQSLKRIQKFQGSVPSQRVSVRTFSEDEMIARRRAMQADALKGARRGDLIFNVKPSEAVVVDGVHVYVQLLDFGTAMLEQGRETEAGHARVLSMLHIHYSGSDRIAEQFEAQRVDYHGPRMHAVIVSPVGPNRSRERAARAIAFAEALKRTIERAGQRFSGGQYSTRVRIGIDSGRAVAVNSGRGSEPEPLFLGNPANNAAKLAEGDQEGIYLSDRIRRELDMPPLDEGLAARVVDYARRDYASASAPLIESLRASDDQVERAVEGALKSYQAALGAVTEFTFRRHTPPLRTIDFAELSPSNSVRMGLLSIFADIDQFTNYVNACLQDGRVAEMVSNLHVIRHELAATLKEDFDGRKVRFIGDCIHGLVAEGTRHETDCPSSVEAAVGAAAGMRSSFELCQEVLPNIRALGLAVGIEFGTTPITRLGIRGDRSVRAAVSKAVTASEELQSRCTEGDETRMGPRALQHASAGIQRLFLDDGTAYGLDYESFSQHLSAPAVLASGTASVVAQPHSR